MILWGFCCFTLLSFFLSLCASATDRCRRHYVFGLTVRPSIPSSVCVCSCVRPSVNFCWIFTVQLHVMQRTVLLSLFCPSVRPSVRPSDACIVTKLNNANILIPHETAMTLVFWYQEWFVGDAPSLWNLCSRWPTPFEKRRLRPISAHNVSTVRDSEKKSNYDEYKVDHGLSNDGVCTLPLSAQKGGSKSDFFVFE